MTRVMSRMMIPKLEMNLWKKLKIGMMTNLVNQPTSHPPRGMTFSYFCPYDLRVL